MTVHLHLSVAAPFALAADIVSPCRLAHLGRAVITVGGPGQMIIRATASDADGQTGVVEQILNVRNPDDTAAPIIAFDGAVNGAVITVPTAIPPSSMLIWIIGP